MVSSSHYCRDVTRLISLSVISYKCNRHMISPSMSSSWSVWTWVVKIRHLAKWHRYSGMCWVFAQSQMWFTSCWQDGRQGMSTHEQVCVISNLWSHPDGEFQHWVVILCPLVFTSSHNISNTRCSPLLSLISYRYCKQRLQAWERGCPYLHNYIDFLNH